MANKKISAFTDGGALASGDIIPAVRAGANISITGWGTMAQQSASSVTITGGTITGITDLAIADGGTGASTAAAARANLGLILGTDVQPFDSDLAALAAIATPGVLVNTGVGTAASRTLTGTSNQVVISNGNGISGNPTFSLPQSIATSSSPTFTNMTLTGALNQAKGSDIASAGTIDLGAATGNFVDITGTTTITALGTATAGVQRVVRFTGILTLTHNATSLILPSDASITTAANDRATFVSLGSGNWLCTSYSRADGTALVSTGVTAATQAEMEAASSTAATVTPGRQQYHPSAAKAWGVYNEITTTTLGAGYNVSSLTDNGTGNTTINLTTAFSSSTYAVVFFSDINIAGGNNTINWNMGNRNTTSIGLYTNDSAGTLQDHEYVAFVAYGDQ